MAVIGITGQFCSGKSAVAEMFAHRGAKVIDADKIGHNVLKDDAVCKKLIAHFGKNIAAESGTINRRKLALKVFADKKNHKILCCITHPLLKKKIIEKIKKLKSENPKAIIVIDAAVLIEMGLAKYINKLVVVKAGRLEQYRRAKHKWGLSKADIDSRISLQIPASRLIRKADFIIDNNGSLKNTKKQVEETYRSFGSYSASIRRTV